MNRRRVCGMLLPVVLGSVLLSTPAAQAATAPKTSAIYSQALNVCLDPSTPDPYDTLAGARCSGKAAQTMTFLPVTGAPAHTYEIKDKASGKCINWFRQGIQTGNCGTAWTLELVAGTTKVYRIVLASTLSSGDPDYWGISRVGGGPPNTLFSLGTDPQPHERFTMVAGL